MGISSDFTGEANCPHNGVHAEEPSGPMPLFSDGETEAWRDPVTVY